MSTTPRFQPPSPEMKSATLRGAPVGWYTVMRPRSWKSNVVSPGGDDLDDDDLEDDDAGDEDEAAAAATALCALSPQSTLSAQSHPAK
jgi:hypothetical protein